MKRSLAFVRDPKIKAREYILLLSEGVRLRVNAKGLTVVEGQFQSEIGKHIPSS